MADLRGQVAWVPGSSRGLGRAIAASAPNAGKPNPNAAVHISLDDIRAILDRNLFSTILVCRAVAPETMQPRAGHIVTIGSVDALRGTAGNAPA